MSVKQKHKIIQKAYWTTNTSKDKSMRKLLSCGKYDIESIQHGILTDTYTLKTYRCIRAQKNILKFMPSDLLLVIRERRLTKLINKARYKEAFNCG